MWRIFNKTTSKNNFRSKYSTIIDALKNNDFESIEKLIVNGHSPNIKYNGLTLLYYNVLSDAYDNTKFLLEHGVNATQKNDWYFDYENFDDNIDELGFRLHSGKTPIEKAIDDKNHKILDLFLEYNISDDELDKYLTKKLCISILNENLDDIKQYLNYGADINQMLHIHYDEILYNELKNYDSKSPLEVALDIHNQELVKILLENNPTEYEIIDWIFNQETDMVKSFIQNSYSFIFLCFSIIKNREDLFYFIIENYNIDFSKKLDMAKKNYQFSKYIGLTPLEISIEKENVEFIQKIFTLQDNIDKINVIKLACKKQNFKIVKMLVENGANVNLKDNNGNSPLFEAIEVTRANKEIIRYLIQNGADIYQENDKGISPLSFAETNKKSLVKVLTESIPIKLDENLDATQSINFKELNDKVSEQNKVINKLKKDIQTLSSNKKIDEMIETINKQTDTIETLEKEFKQQSNEIISLKEKLNEKDEKNSDTINDLIMKIEKLEKTIKSKKYTKKEKTPLSIPLQSEPQSINKNDGVVVQRESFYDF